MTNTLTVPEADFGKARDYAKRVLNENNVLEPPVRIDQIVPSYGLSIFSTTFPDEYGKIAGFIDLNKRIIAVNAADPVTRQIFTVAHELGHHLMHAEQLKDDPDTGIVYRLPLGALDIEPLEQEANCFAAHLLVPDRFLDEYGDEDVGVLARMFGVSTDVVGFRLVDRRRKTEAV